MNLLELLPDDVRKRLNPSGSPNGFLGANSVISADEVQESIDEHVETVFSRLPWRNGALTERVRGEYLVQSAFGGETTVQLGLFPVTASTVRIWVNLDRPWDSRRSSDALRDGDGCSVNADTGLVTLDEALLMDDVVVGEYSHSAMSKCHLLRRIAVDLTAVEWARRLYPDDLRFDRYTEWEKRAIYDLARLKGTKDGERMGILMFDRLDLINETAEDRMVGGGELDAGGEMM